MHLKDLQKICDPIIGRLYQQSGAGGPRGAGPSDDADSEEPEDTGF